MFIPLWLVILMAVCTLACVVGIVLFIGFLCTFKVSEYRDIRAVDDLIARHNKGEA
jgi:general stress protein CsbA